MKDGLKTTWHVCGNAWEHTNNAGGEKNGLRSTGKHNGAVGARSARIRNRNNLNSHCHMLHAEVIQQVKHGFPFRLSGASATEV